MYPNIANTNRPHFLNGWKEIANYLGKGVRTAQRYERNFALPIRRPSGRLESAVMATRAEIDAWLSASTRRQMLTPVAPLECKCGEMRRNIARMTQLRAQIASARTELRTNLSRLKQASLRGEEAVQRISQSAPADFLGSAAPQKLNCPLLVQSIHDLTPQEKAPTRTGTERNFEIGTTAKPNPHRAGHLASHRQAK